MEGIPVKGDRAPGKLVAILNDKLLRRGLGNIDGDGVRPPLSPSTEREVEFRSWARTPVHACLFV
eukprot:685239-Rhodomonas_salina.1